MDYYSRVSTGWQSLDTIIDSLRKGDNVVWQVDNVDDYQRVLLPFVNSAVARNERVVYLRFGRHTPLLEERANITIYPLKMENSFESFSAKVHSIITREGREVCYVFDSLSDLLHLWATDSMISDFFFITCPYLFELNTIAYFALLRNSHSYKAIARIRETTQILIDIHNYEGRICIHPIKVQHRYSPTMFFPHIKEKDELVPVINSVDAAQLFSHLSRYNITTGAHRYLDYWDRLFMQARELLDSGASPEERRDMVQQLSRLMLTRNQRLLSMVQDYFSLEDLLRIKERLIGSGFIGGKAVGMLLARNILLQDNDFDWQNALEHHDSFYIGSDIFYSYIVQNGWWQTFMAHKTREGYLPNAQELKNKMAGGNFPEEIVEQFKRMLEYFGQSPIIVRSSSLLEDAFGSAFAGKYESYFCVNQESPEKRYDSFEEAVRLIYASTMSEDALNYRLQRGLDQTNEQMALLVQRVSGASHKSYFFPELAGVGLSRNPFVWKKGMKAEEGMIRLVFGLGTRAVNRVERDYPRIVAVDDPLVKPLISMSDIRKFSQHFVDLLNLEKNQIETISLEELLAKEVPENINLIGIQDREATQSLRDMGKPEKDFWVLTFDPFLTQTPFIPMMQRMLGMLEKTYENPVDIEFTVNFNSKGDMQINLLQCRPFQTLGFKNEEGLPENIPEDRTLIRLDGNFMGGSISQNIARIILVDPEAYVALSVSEKYSVARLIGKLNRFAAHREQIPTLLMGPGRWGTHSPSMGVPVNFSEINHVAVMAEISYQSGSLIPDLSFGTHFFHDLIETGIFYLAIYPESPDVVFNLEWIRSRKNLLGALVPESSRFEHVVKVVDTRHEDVKFQSDVVNQRVVCYLSNPEVGNR
ncbi:MAG: PEP/pyruvate-binding domain-containing protein [Proteobacteria bacterium]|nr:PEP/pyruvate-binding domain-containing protein [Pseudomonadota bacterium]MBU4471066.1 PEP/pyruvate-binding domain-containing protein [Pseudomonadota bacterium]MCG2753666.1 PEP/pyruvate-binding domain-containing protein [Desulfobacteraceae bacterium]